MISSVLALIYMETTLQPEGLGVSIQQAQQ